MDAILKHMLDMTGKRDHHLLDLSILSAVWQMAGAQQARMLILIPQDSKTLVLTRGWVCQQEIKVLQDDEDPANNLTFPKQELSQFPALAKCLAQHHGCAKARGADGLYMLWLPIWIEEKAHICLEVARPTKYSRHIVDLLEGMVGVYRNFQSLLEYSETDSLTGLLNRKTFERYFSRARQFGSKLELAEGHHNQTQGAPASVERRHLDESKQEWLAVVDIDHFKQVNDNFGHLYGDEVLILVANLMTRAFREQDKIFRFGGEEFVIMIHAANIQDVRAAVERFRLCVQNYRFPQVGQITVSIGYTSFHSRESPVEVLGHADQALYYAKSHGRNQSCHYEQLVADGELVSAHALPTAPTEYF